MVASAKTWLNTPYHHNAMVKGAGIDCGQLIIAAFLEAGLINETPAPDYYTCDWHLHRDEDKYLECLEKELTRLPGDDDRSVDTRLIDDPAYALPAGEVIAFRVGRTYSHGGIITQWPRFIHAYLPAGIVEEVDLRHTPMSTRPARIYTYGGYDL